MNKKTKLSIPHRHRHSPNNASQADQNQPIAYILPRKRDISKIIFLASEDESSSQQEDNHETLCHTARDTTTFTSVPIDKKLQRASFRAETTMLRPSLMQTYNQEQDYHTQTKFAQKSNNPVCLQEPSVQIGIVRKEMPSSLLFMGSDEQQQNQQLHIQEQQQIIETPQLAQQQQSSKSATPSSNQQSNVHQNQQNMPTSVKQQSSQSDKKTVDEGVNLLHITLAVKKRSAYFEQAIKDSHNCQGIPQLMFTPLRQGTVHIFEVHVYSGIIEKTYQLWMDSLPAMKLLMKATKSVRLHKTCYELLTYLEESNEYCQACTIISNLDRSQFSIQSNSSQQVKLLGTVSCSTSLQNTKNLVLYYPSAAHFIKDEETPSLKYVFSEQHNSSVEYLVTTKLKVEERLQLMNDHRLKVSDKSMEFKGKSGELRLIIGKKGSKRYTIIAGPHLTPIQIFSLAIVNIETS